jgi:hypothetical protein
MILSLHEYDLRHGASAEEFERTLREAESLALLDLPGLRSHHFLRGVRGLRDGRYAALWVYDRREAWEALWGPAGRPIHRDDHPPRWRQWEDGVLTAFLDRPPDEVRFTAYEVID